MLYTPRPASWENEPQWDEIDADSEEAEQIRKEYLDPKQDDLWKDFIYDELHRRYN